MPIKPLIVKHDPLSILFIGSLTGPAGVFVDRTVTIPNAPSTVDLVTTLRDESLSSRFSVISIVVYDVEMFNGGLVGLDEVRSVNIPQGVISSVFTFDPVLVETGQRVIITLRYKSMNITTESFHGQLELKGTGSGLAQADWKNIIVPFSTLSVEVHATFLNVPKTIRQGDTVEFDTLVSLWQGPPTQVSLKYFFPEQSYLDSPYTNVFVDTLNVPVRSKFRLSCDLNAPLGKKTLLILLSAFNGKQLQDVRPFPEITVVKRKPPRIVDGNIRWEQANFQAIAVDRSNPDNLIWHAGRTMDLLVLDDGNVLAGTQNGGVWTLGVKGFAFPHSNQWDCPEVRCLAKGPGPSTPGYFFAAVSGGNEDIPVSIYVTDPSKSFTNFFLHWDPVEVRDTNGKLVVTINRIIFINDINKVLLAADSGVYWADTPLPSSQKYVFQQASPVLNCFDAAIGSNNSVVIATGDGNGIYSGTWINNQLVLSYSPVADINGNVDSAANKFNSRSMFSIMLTSCDKELFKIMYAIAQKTPGSGQLNGLYKSIDGGKTWRFIEAQNVDSNKPFIDRFVPDPLFKAICVSPVNSEILLYGDRDGPLLSTDGGKDWKKIDKLPEVHADKHAIRFSNDPAGQTFYVASDGGVAYSTNMGKSWFTTHNNQFQNLQFLYHQFRISTMDVSDTSNDLYGGGCQDNGVVLIDKALGGGPWLQITDGDGSLFRFVHGGHLIYAEDSGQGLKWQQWDGNKLIDRGIVPIFDANGVLESANGLVGDFSGGAFYFTNMAFEIVNKPHYRGFRGDLLYAVCSVNKKINGNNNSEIFGLFAKDDGKNMHWQYLVSLDLNILALGSYNGHIIWIGTDHAQIVALNTQSLIHFELFVPEKHLHPDMRIERFAIKYDTEAYAMCNNPSRILKAGPLRWDAINTETSAGDGLLIEDLEEESFSSLELDYTIDPTTLFLATEKDVYSSYVGGKFWLVADLGLPKRTYASDLRFVVQPDGQKFIYLSTNGRSIWRARL